MPENAIETEIRSRVSADDPAALDLIWDQYGARLYCFLVGLLQSSHDAEDVLQDVLVKIASQRARLLEVENLQAYFYSMARNEALTLIKKRTRRHQPIHPDDLWLVPVDDSPLSEDSVQKVRKTLEILPEQQRTVLVLKIYQDMTFHEIADALGISLNTAASRYRYAMDKLRGLLNQEAL
jgi:RNA polymerase sigma-70 factor (ECF subfamily)